MNFEDIEGEIAFNMRLRDAVLFVSHMSQISEECQNDFRHGDATLEEMLEMHEIVKSYTEELRRHVNALSDEAE